MMWIAYTGKELLRKKMLAVTLSLTALFVSFFWYGLVRMAESLDHSSFSAIQAYIQGGVTLTLGLFFAQMLGAFFVLFSTMGTISGEIDSGLLLAVLARPVPRWHIYFGKWFGYAVWSLLYNAILFGVILLAVHLTLGLPLFPAAAAKGLALFEGISLLLAALSLLGSTYLPPIGNGIACGMLYGMGMFSGLLENVLNSTKYHAGVSNFAVTVSMLIPTDALFRRMTYELLGGSDIPLTREADRMLGPFSLSNVPSALFIAYAAVYLILILAWGCGKFQRKDIA